MGKKRKQILRWLIAVILAPVVLFALLALLVYLPPVQNWLVGKVADYASEKTGMEISVGHVNLEFPLDLGVDDFKMISKGDTIANVEHLSVDVELLPLFKKLVVIDKIEVTNTSFNTSDLIATTRVQGNLERLFLTSRGVDLDRSLISLNGAVLEGAKVSIFLNDTTVVDTTSSSTEWKILADSLTVLLSQVDFHSVGDSLSVNAVLGRAVAYTGIVDLKQEQYSVERFLIRDGQVAYDQTYEQAVEGLDVNHIQAENINLGADSIFYSPERLSLRVGELAFREKSGIEVTEGHAAFAMDSLSMSVEDFMLKTLDSEAEGEVFLSFKAAPDGGLSDLSGNVNATLGKQDMLSAVANLPEGMKRGWPNYPISVKGSFGGTLEEMKLGGVVVDLPTAFHVTADGFVAGMSGNNSLSGKFDVHARGDNLDFISSLVEMPVTIPRGITLDGTIGMKGDAYDFDVAATEGKGSVTAKGSVDLGSISQSKELSYDAEIAVRNLNVSHFMPRDSIYEVSGDLVVSGYGTDFFAPSSRLEASASLSNLHYGKWNITDLIAEMELKNGRGRGYVESHNALADGKVNFDALLSSKKLDATIGAELNKVDLKALRIMDEHFDIGMCGHFDVSSNLAERHRVEGYLSELYINDGKHVYLPTDISVDLSTDKDTTWAHLRSGDIKLNLTASGGYEPLLDKLTKLSEELQQQLTDKVIDQPKLLSMLPTMHLDLRSGNDNPLMTFLRKNDVAFKDFYLNLTTSPYDGLNGEGYVYSLVADSNRIDTIDFKILTKAEGRRITERHISYNIHVQNNKRNPQFVFNAMIDGAIHQKGAVLGLRFFDAKDRLGLRIGANAELLETGINLHLVPKRPTIGYKEFALNEDNFIFLGPNNKIEAKLNLKADDGTGLQVYSEAEETEYQQDLTISLNKLNLGELSSVFPYYLPQMEGALDGDFHVVQDSIGKFSVVSDLSVAQLMYEGTRLGNLSSELVYLEKGDDAHAIEARILKDDEEVGLLSGTYYNKDDGALDATFTMQQFPLNIIDGFIPGQLIGLEGKAEGELAVKGPVSKPQVDGEVYLDSSYLVSEPYGIRMRFDNDPVRIVGSHLLLENFSLYAYNDNPLTMSGDVDFSDLDKMSMNVRMRARDFMLINAKRNPRSEAFGKAYVNFFGSMRGLLDDLKMRGRLEVLGSTDLAYILRDSPLTTDNQLDELVKFTDFSDTTETVVIRPQLSGLNMDMTIDVSQGAHVIAYLNTDQSNYVDLMGGGTLRMRYSPAENLRLTGRYTLNNGEMKYSLPVIPLKTFAIQNGSYIEFTGDVMNPTLNITATERVKAPVANGEGTGRSVVFDCGVVITKTLNDMGLEFTLDAPEDMEIHGNLLSMGSEQRGKLAVTMLTTGMYLDDSNTSSFTMNSALSAFLNSEINSITGNALRTLDLSIGMDNTTDATGAMHTDYSFKFSKRLWNNRLRVIIGGKVSSGNEVAERNNSFLDNVSLEYRLDNTANKYISLFYQNNKYDWLDGYTQMFGGGFIWRRTLNSFWEIFSLKNPATPMPRTTMPTGSGNPATPRDTLTMRRGSFREDAPRDSSHTRSLGR